MKIPTSSNRRTVLKIIGAGVVGGTVLTGSASAHQDVTNSQILQVDHSFDPDKAGVDLGESDPATVTFVNEAGIDHNVVIHEAGNGSNLVRSEALRDGEKYQVVFTDNGDGTFTVTETDAFGSAGDDTQSLTASHLSSHTAELHMHCDIHNGGTSDEDAFEMEGEILVDAP